MAHDRCTGVADRETTCSVFGSSRALEEAVSRGYSDWFHVLAVMENKKGRYDVHIGGFFKHFGNTKSVVWKTARGLALAIGYPSISTHDWNRRA